MADHIGADMVCEAIDAAVACRRHDGRDVAGTILQRFAIRQVRVRISKQNLGWTTGGRAVIEVTRGTA